MSRRIGRALAMGLAGVVALGACSSPQGSSPTSIAGMATASASTGDSGREFVTGLTIPWAVGGQRQFRDGTTKHEPGEWPSVRVPAIRLWDGFTTWANLEPRRNAWEFRRLDRFVDTARRNGTTDITLVLAGTPRWAASQVRSTDAAWIGPGSASFPTDIELWRNYVRTVAERYAGRITAYEIGNEPNMPMFWTGTQDQYRRLVEVAANEINAVDPNATIVAQAGLVRRPKDVAAVAAYATALGSIDSVDVISAHIYPRARRLDKAPALLDATRAAIGRHPAWITEVNVSRAGGLGSPEQAAAIGVLTEQMRRAGIARAYWYAWTVEGAPGLIPLHAGSPAGGALLAHLRPSPD